MIKLHRVLKALSTLYLCVAMMPAPAAAQHTSKAPQDYIPPELKASEPEIRAYLESTDKLEKDGNYADISQQLQKALDLCVRKGFLSDKALLEEKLGSTFFLMGNLEEAKRQWVMALSDSAKTGNLVLQADTLVALSAMEQGAGKLREAIDLATRALDLARKSKDLFIQSRCLGELGRLQLTANKQEEARASIEEALRIDRLNHYKWEPSHLLYLAWLSQSASKLDEAIQLANSARELAIEQENYLVFMQASESLGQAYVSKNELGPAIALLEHSRDGISENGKQFFQNPNSYRAAMSLPYPRIVFLEAIALAYQAGRRIDDALRSWQQLYDVAQTAGFALASAEAIHHMADIYQTKKEWVQAITDYDLAAGAWAKGGNLQRQVDALTSEALLLGQQGNNEKGAQVYEEALPLIKTIGDKSRQFFVDLCIVELLQAKGDPDRSVRALRDADSLLSPNLTLENVEPKFILELYLRMADLHSNEKISQLIDLEKAMTPAEGMGAKTMASVDSFVKEKIASIHLNQEAEKAYGSGELANALVYFELLQHFEQTDAKWNGIDYKTNVTDPIMMKLFELPSKIAAQPDGVAFLETNIRQMGPVATRARLPILLALSSHFTALQRHDLVVKFDSEAVQYANLENPGPWDVAVVCHLTISLMFQKDIDSAVKRVGACLRGAQMAGNPQLLATAHQTNVWVLEAAGRREEAAESIRYLLQHAPEDPSLYVQKAQLDTQQGERVASLESWKHALLLFEGRKDLSNAASAHLAIADSLSVVKKDGDDEQRMHLEAALGLYRDLNDAAGQVRACILLAEFFGKKKDTSHARAFFDTALKLSHQARMPNLEANVLSQIGQLYRPAEPVKALDYYRRAESIYHNQNDTVDEAFQLQNESWTLDDLKRPEEALQTALKGKLLADKSGSWLARYWVRRLLGSLYANRGEYENGLTVVREARAISDSANQPLYSAWAASSLAIGFVTIGDWEEARAQIDFALPILKNFKDVDDEFAAYSQLMDIYGARESELKDLTKALEYYDSAYQLVKNDKERAAGLALAVEEIYWQQGRFKEAIAKAKEALEYYQQAKDQWDQANALMSLAEAQRSDGDIHGAAESLSVAEPLVKRTHNFYTTGRFFYGQANQRKKEGRFKEAIAEYERVIAMLEQFKSTSDLNNRRKVSETYSFIYDELIDAYYSLGNQDQQFKISSANQALKYAELNKARSFTNSWGRTFVESLKRQLPSQLQERERALSADEDALQSELAQSMSGQGTRSVKQVQGEIQNLAKEQSALRRDLRQSNPAYAEVRYPLPISISDLPLRSGEMLIEFKLLNDALMVWFIRGTQSAPELVAFYKVDHSRQWFEDRILAIRSAFNRAQPELFDPKISEELFNGLFPAQFANYLINSNSIIFVPDDILFLLPFEMLSPKASQSQFVLLNTRTSYFPSAAALRLSRKASPTKREWQAQFLGIADPITSADDERYAAATIAFDLKPVKLEASAPNTQAPVSAPLSDGLKTRDYLFSRLPDSAIEVKKIAALFGSDPSGTVVRTGDQASKSEVMQTDLGRFRFVHFATHGFFPVEPGIREPALVLSYDGKDVERMMLTLPEVLQLRLHAELVVLSACNTGSGKVTRAEGVASLGTAFLVAGASSAAVSLWKVRDKTTSILMEEFYRNILKGMTKNAALAGARSALLSKGYSNPFYWAPFVLTGE